MTACTQATNTDPINLPLAAGAPLSPELGHDVGTYYDDTMVALSFSGGGTRAAAFSFGVLNGLNETTAPNRSTSLLERVDFVTGVSGGSVLAAYYGLKKRKALQDFRERFLLRNAEEGLQTKLDLLSIAKGLSGGINDSTAFPRWLDDNLFDHATFKSLLYQRRPTVWINASDVYDRTPFVFGRTIFSALCSDLSAYPVSLAVAASAAVPVVFSPVVVQGFPGTCSQPLPDWLPRVRADSNAPPLLRLYANALERYRNGEVHYVKLFDGGLFDNFGLAGLTIARLAADTPFGPLEPEEAVKLRRLLFLVVDAGQAPSGDWVKTVQGPSGVDMVGAITNTATESGAVGSYSAFQNTMADWQENLAQWRCKLSAADRRRFGAPPGWNCKDIRFFIGRISFEQFDQQRQAALNAVETRFRLPQPQVDMLIDAGREALKTNGAFHSFLKSLEPVAPRGRPVTQDMPQPAPQNAAALSAAVQ